MRGSCAEVEAADCGPVAEAGVQPPDRFVPLLVAGAEFGVAPVERVRYSAEPASHPLAGCGNPRTANSRRARRRRSEISP